MTNNTFLRVHFILSPNVWHFALSLKKTPKARFIEKYFTEKHITEKHFTDTKFHRKSIIEKDITVKKNIMGEGDQKHLVVNNWIQISNVHHQFFKIFTNFILYISKISDNLTIILGTGGHHRYVSVCMWDCLLYEGSETVGSRQTLTLFQLSLAADSILCFFK